MIVPHLHIDHWDKAAQKGLSKATPIFAQNSEDAQRIRAAGFTDVVASHLEALGHATQTRQELTDFIKHKQLDPRRVLVPKDGQSYSF